MSSAEALHSKMSHTSTALNVSVPVTNNLCLHNSNNSNNTKATEDPFMVNNTHKTSTQKVISEVCTTTDTSKNPSSTQQSCQEKKTSIIRQQWKLDVSSQKTNDVTKSHTSGTPSITRMSGVQSKSSVFQKWADMDEGSRQRPLAKRQLSAESSACNLRLGKRSTEQKDESEGRILVKSGSKSMARTRDGSHSASDASTGKDGGVTRRKLKKELYASEETFIKVDAHVINTGKEVRIN